MLAFLFPLFCDFIMLEFIKSFAKNRFKQKNISQMKKIVKKRGDLL